MARFYCDLSPVDGDGTKLEVYAKFTGGSSDYSYERSIDVRVIGVGVFEFNSAEVGGSTSTFSGYVTGLSPGTKYEWVCNLYYWNGDWEVSDYSDEGTATTYADSDSGKTYINVGSYKRPDWQCYVAYINVGTDRQPNWVVYTPYVNYGSDSRPSWA